MRIILLAAFPVMMGLSWVVPRLPIYWNHSPSVPLGLYYQTKDMNAPYAAFRIPRKAQEIAYWQKEWNERTVFLKPLLAASPEHPVILTPRGTWYNGKLLPNTAPQAQSLDGHPLPHYPFGTYTKGLWAVSSYNAHSFDSRYWGPIDAGDILSYVKPLL